MTLANVRTPERLGPWGTCGFRVRLLVETKDLAMSWGVFSKVWVNFGEYSMKKKKLSLVGELTVRLGG